MKKIIQQINEKIFNIKNCEEKNGREIHHNSFNYSTKYSY
jgi:hypothetical protein